MSLLGVRLPTAATCSPCWQHTQEGAAASSCATLPHPPLSPFPACSDPAICVKLVARLAQLQHMEALLRGLLQGAGTTGSVAHALPDLACPMLARAGGAAGTSAPKVR